MAVEQSYKAYVEAQAIPGVTWNTLRSLALRRASDCVERTYEHNRQARRNRWFADPLTWAIAVLAGVSGVTAVANNTTWATFLALFTAVVAATNAALNPGEQARRHNAAAIAYDKIRVRIEDYLIFDLRESDDVIPEDIRKELRKTYLELEQDITSVAESSPPIGGDDPGFSWTTPGVPASGEDWGPGSIGAAGVSEEQPAPAHG